MKKISISFSAIIILSFILIINIVLLYGFVKNKIYKYNKLSSYNEKLISQLKTYQDNDIKLKNMQNSLIISFGISKYEAKVYSQIFNELSTQYNIPWEIYPSLIRIESNFKSKLTSEKGAFGITQVLDGTAREVSDSLDIEYNIDTKNNDILNIYIGLTYLSIGIQKEGIENGIRRYLGGPGHKTTAINNSNMRTYIGTYKSSVWQEFEKLKYLYRGVTVSDSDDVYIK